MKRCCQCKHQKPLAEFGVSRAKPDGLQPRCKECNREQARNYYHATNQRCTHASRASTRLGRIRQAIACIKSKVGCLFCGEKCPICLDLHHVDDNKEFTLSRCVCSIEKIIKEVSKCEVLCSNCHRKVHGGMLAISTKRELDRSPLEIMLKRRLPPQAVLAQPLALTQAS